MQFEKSDSGIILTEKYSELFLIKQILGHLIYVAHDSLKNQRKGLLEDLESVYNRINHQFHEQQSEDRINICLSNEEFKLMADFFWLGCEEIGEEDLLTIFNIPIKKARKFYEQLREIKNHLKFSNKISNDIH